MKSQTIIYTLIFIFVSVLGYGQSHTFKVLANKGGELKKEGEWISLKTGALVYDKDEIKLPENPYLGLIHASGKTMVLKDAGTYKVSELASQMDKEGSSVASKYADFVLSKMSAEGKKNRLSATGAVDRGGEEEIKIFLPRSVGVYSESPILQWTPIATTEGGDVKYHIVFTNMFEDELMKVETSTPHYEINLADPKLVNENFILVKVTTEAGETIESNTSAIKKLPPEDAEKVKTTLDELLEGMDEDTALTKFIVAGYYEENNLLADALTNYIHAMEMAPDVDSFKEAYEEFLLRNRLK